MKTIWKFPLVIEDVQAVNMPGDFEPLAVQVQGEAPCLWAMVDPTSPKVPVNIYTFGTGHPIEKDTGRMIYMGTYQVKGGSLVWHVFADLMN